MFIRRNLAFRRENIVNLNKLGKTRNKKRVIFMYLPIHLFVFLSFYLFVCLSIFDLSVYVYVDGCVWVLCMYVYKYVSMCYVCMYIYVWVLCTYLYVCVSVYVKVWISLYTQYIHISPYSKPHENWNSNASPRCNILFCPKDMETNK